MAEFIGANSFEEREDLFFENPVWWNVSVGYETYEVKAHSEEEVKDIIDKSIKREEEARVFVSLSTSVRQKEMNERYTEDGRDLIQTIPFTSIEFPNSYDDATPEQQDALQVLFND